MANLKNARKTDGINDTNEIVRTIADDVRDGIVKAFDIDSFGQQPETLPLGEQIVRIKLWEVVPERRIVSHYMGKEEDTGKVSKPYIRLELETKKGARIETRLYDNQVSGFMKNMIYQSSGRLYGVSLSNMLRLLQERPFSIWVSLNPKTYTPRVDYFDREAWEASKKLQKA